MESKDEVHSDHSDGSYELVNIDDYASEKENMDAVTSSNMDLSDGSYDFLCSEVSDTLVLTEEEAFNDTIVSEGKPSEELFYFLSKSANEDMEFKSATGSDFIKEEKGPMGLKSETGSDPMKEDSEKGEMVFKGETSSDPKKEDEEGDMIFERASDIDLDVEPIPHRVKKSKKRNLMAMIYDNPNFDVDEFPAQIQLKEDIKEVAKNHIIRYLPAKSLAQSRLVSKEWNQWIKSPFFAHMQSQYFRKTSGFFHNERAYGNSAVRFISLNLSAYGVPYPSLRFLPSHVIVKNSCNGLLLCQAVTDANEYYVCNPANQHWHKLPPSSYYHGENPKIVLAFQPSSLNFDSYFQVICPFSLPDLVAGPIVYFDIYDSNTRSWKVSEMICVDLDESEVKSDGIFINGGVYWETTGGELLAVDLKNEIYSVQTIPSREGGALSNVHGEICYVKATYIHALRSCILDVYGGGVMSLKDSFDFEVSVDGVEDGEVVDCMVLGNSSDDVIAVVVKISEAQKWLYVYHVKDEEVEEPFFLWGSDKLFPYVNSLVSLHG